MMSSCYLNYWGKGSTVGSCSQAQNCCLLSYSRHGRSLPDQSVSYVVPSCPISSTCISLVWYYDLSELPSSIMHSSFSISWEILASWGGNSLFSRSTYFYVCGETSKVFCILFLNISKPGPLTASEIVACPTKPISPSLLKPTVVPPGRDKSPHGFISRWREDMNVWRCSV